MLFAAASVELLGSDTEEMHLRTLLFPCYLQLLGWRCWGAIRRRRICGRCCCHAICSCWGAGPGERYGGDESADAAVTMLFAAVGVEVLESETAETNLRTLLFPCYLQLLGWGCWGARRRRETHLRTLLLPCYLRLLGWRCWGARLPRRICGRCCCHAICSCCGAGTGERDGGDESADAAVTMLFAAVGVEVRRICGRCCYHAICSCKRGAAGERYGGDASADAAVPMLFAAVRVEVLGSETTERRICGRCCYHAICSCWGGGAGERDGGDESADTAVTMLFAAASVELLGSETTETNLRTLLFPCYLQLLGCRCWGARRRRRICGRCCYHAICSCWDGGAGERDYRDESADAAVAMLFAAFAVQVLGSETEETNLRTLLLPCYLQLLGWRCWGARRRRRICGRCCYHAICSCWGAGAGLETEETNLRTLLLPCYLQLLGCRCWGARRRRRICGRCCYHAICSCWGAAAGERDCGDEVADAAVTMRIGDWGRRRRSCGRWWWRMLLFKQAEFKGSGFWTPIFLISKSFFYRGRLF